MQYNQIITGDCFDLIKNLPDNSVDLVITSPPYADIVSYSKKVSIKKPNEYCDWLLPLFTEIHRVLKPSGSFILNINDKCVNGYRSTFIYELIYRSQKETPLKFYEQMIWHKKSGVPNGSEKRFRNMTEFLFHFVKDKNELKFYMDRVLEEPAEGYIKRMNAGPTNNDSKIVDGKRERQQIKWIRNNDYITNGIQDHTFAYRVVPDKVRPDNVFRFPTAGQEKFNTLRHPAPFNTALPRYFINLLTDEGDVVLDVFNGIGTTSVVAKEMNRQYIGYELNEMYADFSRQRLEGKTPPKKKIAQCDLDGTQLKLWDTITQIENELGFDSHNHIEDCIRKGNKTSYGYKWKLVDEDTSDTSI